VYVFKIAEKVCYERANNAKSASEIGRVNEVYWQMGGKAKSRRQLGTAMST